MSKPATAKKGPENFLRLHWFDLGIVLASLVGAYVLIARLSGLTLVLWLSLAALFVHQFEEYRYPGYFPGLINSVFFSSKQPDRYPLNTNSAVAVNLGAGWTAYFLAAIVNVHAIWLGIAVTIISVGNIVEKIVTKYLGDLKSPMAKGLIEAVRKGSEVLVEITP